MKFRRNKVKREHGILEKALEWLEELSKLPEVTDIIPGVIDVTHSSESGPVYKYETATGCKILLKSGGSVQEAFIVTKNPKAIKKWIETRGSNPRKSELIHDKKLMKEKSELDDQEDLKKKHLQKKKSQPGQIKNSGKGSPQNTVQRNQEDEQDILVKRDQLRTGIKDSYQLVEINPRLRDSYVESLASMADLDGPKLEETLNSSELQALDQLKIKLESGGKPEKKKKR
ncbi:hypothetical protein Sgly_1955 [Syntrophobotulus glycolicus DSM 8271]|uniref:Uncharacterized protein n=1 Tax=Syntrophobotulus glycolicus (strain DSM 8271 / FlGlyR) TaxID=645991 RepID=F0T0W2_SYNGF|nr:DUF2103 domain-containing protein [Syntrophobotulus glycolicus]ADY56251.1 hypothetical protein Sgly_1955 [Syntrophobotulus glycolicus DSM 8271]